MGAMAPYFQVFPTQPGGIPTNAALVASQHMAWEVKVLDGGSEVGFERLHRPQFGNGAGYEVLKPLGQWPAGKTLRLKAKLGSSDYTLEHTIQVGAGPHLVAPVCAWTGPIAPDPRGPSIPEGAWPTNMPYRPSPHRRTFALPSIISALEYALEVMAIVDDRGKLYRVEGLIPHGAPPSVETQITDLADHARIVGLRITDMAGNHSAYGRDV